ncbi:hypothetical protein V7124_19565 [Neobacillus niacini]|uniref:hypothetical protein n=1 Tax=Neobacillus niacini TaxID=86668 RepID=UPI0030008E4C
MSRWEVENPMVVDWLWRDRTPNDDYYADVFEEEDNEVVCCICNSRMLKEDANDSEKFEDVYLCDSRTCNDKHYEGWSESMELQKYYRKKEKAFTGNEHLIQG